MRFPSLLALFLVLVFAFTAEAAPRRSSGGCANGQCEMSRPEAVQVQAVQETRYVSPVYEPHIRQAPMMQSCGMQQQQTKRQGLIRKLFRPCR